MKKFTSYKLAVINITTQPHSPEGYIALFKEAFSAKPPVKEKYHGKEFISLVLSANEVPLQGEHVLHGLVYRYTRISDTPWYDATLGEPLEEGMTPAIDTSRHYPNLSLFDFVFEADGHRLFLVSKHKQQIISANLFANALKNLLNRSFLIQKYGPVDVSVETDAKSLEAIQNMDRLEKLCIRVTLPNDDDISSKKSIFVSRMRKQGARRLDEIFKAERGESLKPDEETKAHMELALSNGFVMASGKENGKKIIKKSSEYPIELTGMYDESLKEPLVQSVMLLAGEQMPYFKTRQKNE